MRPGVATSSCALFVLLSLSPGVARAQEFSTGALKIKFGGRIQVQAGTSSCDEYPVPADSRCAEQVASTDLFLRRVRLTVDGEITDRIDFRIEPDYNKVDELGLKDAWGRFKFSDAAQLKVGHFKRPFDGFELVSSTQILTIERAVVVRGLETFAAPSLGAATAYFNLGDRDIGAELSGSTGGGLFSYWVGMFTGDSDLRSQDTNAEKQFVGRAQLAFEPGGIPLRIAAAAAATDQGYETEDRGLQAEYYYDYELFAELGDFGGGPHVQAGLVFGDNPRQSADGGSLDLAAGDGFASFVTWQAIASWKLSTEVLGLEAIEPLLRVTWGDPNTDVDDDAGWGFTPGVQFFFHRRNKLALNWDVASWEEDGIRSENSFKAQVQFHF
ncbi:MAG: porin [Gemmatimonadota bacterium]